MLCLRSARQSLCALASVIHRLCLRGCLPLGVYGHYITNRKGAKDETKRRQVVPPPCTACVSGNHNPVLLLQELSVKFLRFDFVFFYITGKHHGQSAITGYIAGGAEAILQSKDGHH